MILRVFLYFFHVSLDFTPPPYAKMFQEVLPFFVHSAKMQEHPDIEHTGGFFLCGYEKHSNERPPQRWL